MKERPILFSGPMVRAILEGRKTQTRRVVRAPTEDLNHPAVHHWQMDQESRAVAVAHSERVAEQYITTFPYYRIRCPYGQPGDRLWVRETWQEFFDDEIPEGRTRSVRGRMGIPAEPERLSYVAFRADGEMPDHPIAGKAVWRPSIHMPRWASRITLEITGVRVERLQDISEHDAIAEGIGRYDNGTFGLDDPGACMGPSATVAFMRLWDSINAKRAPWASNPWVWVLEFSLI